jgi:hypothetical protein
VTRPYNIAFVLQHGLLNVVNSENTLRASLIVQQQLYQKPREKRYNKTQFVANDRDRIALNERMVSVSCVKNSPHPCPDLCTRGIDSGKGRERHFLLCSEAKEGDARMKLQLDDDRAAGKERAEKPEDNFEDAAEDAEDEMNERADNGARKKIRVRR